MKILVTGGNGMVGSAFSRIETNHTIVSIGRQEADLINRAEVLSVIDKVEPDAVIHLAAKVGGVKGNTEFVADFYVENTLMNVNVLDCCHEAGIPKVLSLLSTCIYPDDVKYPLTEEQIHHGPPHISNFGYAYAKRMLDIHSRALRQQYGRNYICAVPNNLYGPHDNFDLENSHVIPAIIRKIWDAKKSGTTPTFWGDGSPLREFTYSNDIANCLLYLLENYSGELPINVGNVGEVSIKSVIEKVCEIMDYSGGVLWDPEKPAGQFRKPSDNSRFIELGWDPEKYTDFGAGLKETIDWFLKSYPNVRGMNK